MSRVGGKKRIIILAQIALLLLLSTPVWAAPQESVTQVPKNTSQGIQVSPVIVEANADPGQKLVLDIQVRNITPLPLIAKGVVNDFVAKDEAGNPNIILDTDEPAGTYSLRSWVKEAPNVLLSGQETKSYSFTVDVPKNAEPGGHYGVIRFTAVASELIGDDSALSLSASIGTLVLLRVSGDVKESARVEEFFVSRNGKKAGFFESGPINLTERIKNTGNIHVKPTGEVIVKDMFGRAVASLKVNDPPKNVLPDSIRRFEQELSKKWLFGRYTANLNLTYGTTNQVLTGQLVFWVIQWKFIVAALLFLIALFFILRFAIKKYNSMIARKYNNKR